MSEHDGDPYPWEDGTETECERCHHVHLCRHVPDPFLDEVYPEDRPYPDEWLCGTCYSDRRDDV